MKQGISWTAQVNTDAVRVLIRAESVLSFQIATALQNSLYSVLTAGEQLATLLILCVGLEGFARAVKAKDIRMEILRRVLIVQLGQAVQEVLVFKNWASSSTEGVAQGFLLNTLGLCVPGALEIFNPAFMQSAYLQNALAVWLFQYATTTREALARVDFGVSPVFICLFTFALTTRARFIVPELSLYKYVARAWHMLLVDWMLRTLAHATEIMPNVVQIVLWALLIIVVDRLGLDNLSLMQDVRGFTIFRIAAELQRMGLLSVDAGSSVLAALLVFCVHSSLSVLNLQSRAIASFSEVMFVACTNVILQNASVGEGAPQLTLVCIVCVCVYEVQTALTT